MSIASEISRLQSAKATLKTSIENKGVTVSQSATLSDYPALVDSIQTGGGGGTDLSAVVVYVADFYVTADTTVTTGELDRWHRTIYGIGTNAS